MFWGLGLGLVWLLDLRGGRMDVVDKGMYAKVEREGCVELSEVQDRLGEVD